MELVFGGLASAFGGLALFGGIALLMWIDARNKKEQRELEHAERIKALELGNPLPDAELAQSRANINRAWASGLIGLLVPIFLGGMALAMTILLLEQENSGSQLPLLCVVWGVNGVISLVAVVTSLGVMTGPSEPTTKTKEKVRNQLHDHNLIESIRAN